MNISHVDVVIIGAGPYGLSIAAYLNPSGLKYRIFGKPMQSWEQHMPKGMMLKSECFASNLYDPGSSFPLRDYCRQHGLPYADVGPPVPLETFVSYGKEFQQRFVPNLEMMEIASVQRKAGGFLLQTESGEQLEADHVVIAVGVQHFTYLPPPLAGHPLEIVSHTYDHHDLSRFRGCKVVVIGSGASAVDVAALLDQAGVQVDLIARREKIAFHLPVKEPRPLWERIKKPRSGLGLGWKSRLCADFPLIFHVLPQHLRFRAVERHLGPAPGWFMQNAVVGRFPLHLKSTIKALMIADHKAHIEFADKEGENILIVDHVIAGTGFRVALSQLTLLDEPLRQAIRSEQDKPILSRNFESSVPGLYFVGLASAYSFGPLMRFACGAEFTAKRLSRHLSRRSG